MAVQLKKNNMIAEINEFSVFAEIGMGQLAVNAFIDRLSCLSRCVYIKCPTTYTI